MQLITSLFSKLLLMVVGITLAVFLLWHDTISLTPLTYIQDEDIVDVADKTNLANLHSESLVANNSISSSSIQSLIVPVSFANAVNFTSRNMLKKINTTIKNTTVINKINLPQKQVTQTVSLTTSTNPAIWSNISGQLKLDHKANSAPVQKEIKKILADKKKLNQILKSSAPYIYYIYTQTKTIGLPAEIALIPIVESEFNPNDRSNKGATGLWQLMPQTARELGIKVSPSYDGRRNIIASTKAALIYFKDLGKLFKSNWHLAIAAYNCGQVKVQSVVRHAKTTNIWQLSSLPRETKIYVPKLLAVAEILKYPQKYGINLPTTDNKPFFTQIKVKKSVTLKTFGQKNGIDLSILKALNPDFKSGIASVNKSLLVPLKQALGV